MVESYRKKIEKLLNKNGYKIQAIAGVGLDFKHVYIESEDKNPAQNKTLCGANYKDVYFNLCEKLANKTL